MVPLFKPIIAKRHLVANLAVASTMNSSHLIAGRINFEAGLAVLHPTGSYVIRFSHDLKSTKLLTEMSSDRLGIQGLTKYDKLMQFIFVNLN